MTITPRYADKFLNALMDPHHINVEGQLWYDGFLIGTLPLVSGSVTADRAGDVRRTATLEVDPTVLADPAIAAKLNPKGSVVKLSRGVRYPDNSAQSYPIFTGRIDVVESSLDTLSLQCSDMSSFIVDARFTSPYQPYFDNTITDEVKSIIENAYNGVTVVIDDPTAVKVGNAITYEQERGEAINQLLKSVSLEWEADAAGVIHLKKLPAVITTATLPVWIVDSGDAGVLLDTSSSLDRQGVSNFVIVDGEAIDGDVGAHGEWADLDNTSVTWIYGPYGLVVTYFSGQTVRTTAAADALAAELGGNSIAKVEQVQVTCIANPQIQLGDVVRVFSARRRLDKMYFVQSFEMPLDPESPMTMTLFQTLVPSGTKAAGGKTTFKPSPLQIPEGCTWEPTPLT